jgi:creatinine amidohydrolase
MGIDDSLLAPEAARPHRSPSGARLQPMADVTKTLTEHTWPDLASMDVPPVLVLPLGSTEQHGPHLPLDTDSRIAVAVAERAAATRTGVAVAPVLSYGSSGEHAGFPGTLSIGQDALELVLVELVRSADAFAGVVFVCGHGGNASPVRRATATLRSEGRRVGAWFPNVVGGDAHAGRTETSIMLVLDPTAVRSDRIAAGATAPLGELMPALQRGGVRSVAPNGVLGDPNGASVEEGRRLLATLTDDLGALIDGLAEG